MAAMADDIFIFLEENVCLIKFHRNVFLRDTSKIPQQKCQQKLIAKLRYCLIKLRMIWNAQYGSLNWVMIIGSGYGLASVQQQAITVTKIGQLITVTKIGQLITVTKIGQLDP